MLIVSAEQMFAVLLGPAAVMPAAAAPILVALLIANLVQMVAHSLLVHTGFFKQIAKLGIVIAATMTTTTILAIMSGADIVGIPESLYRHLQLRRADLGRVSAARSDPYRQGIAASRAIHRTTAASGLIVCADRLGSPVGNDIASGSK